MGGFFPTKRINHESGSRVSFFVEFDFHQLLTKKAKKKMIKQIEKGKNIVHLVF